MMAKSLRNHPYRHSKNEATILSCQKRVGESILSALSEAIHYMSKRAENNS